MTAPPAGWYIEVDHSSGTVHTPDVLDGARFTPRLLNSGLPSAEIPVPRNEKWQDSGFDRATVRLWKDGQRLPINRLDSAALTPGQTVLSCTGGTELETVVEREYNQADAEDAIRDLVQAETNYGTNVDDQGGNPTESLVQDADSDAEWTDKLRNPIAATDRVEAAGSKLQTTQSLWYVNIDDFNNSNTTWSVEDSVEAFSSNGVSHTETVSVSNQVPNGDARLGIFWSVERGGNASPGFKITIDGTTVASYSSGTFSASVVDAANDNADWDRHDISGDISGDMSGSYNISVEITDSTGATFMWDGVVLYDDRFSYNFDDESDGNFQLAGPELYPDSVQRETVDAITIDKITGGRLDTTGQWNNTGNNQALALSNDQGQSFGISGSNTEEIDGSFASGSSRVRARFTLSRSDETRTNATPTTGYKRQSVDLYELFADLENVPQLIDQRFEGSLVSVIQEVCDQGDFIAEVTYDPGTGFTVEMTRPGQRTGSVDPDTVAYELSRDTAAVYEKAIIEGKLLPVRDESISANVGTYVDLDNDYLDPTSERVSDGSTVFVEGEDYLMDWAGGRLKALSVGSITDGASLSVDYRHKSRGTYTDPAAGANPRELVETIPAITTDRGAEEAAKRIIEQVSTPIETATVTVDNPPAGTSLVDALTVDSLPTDAALEVYEVDDALGETTLQLGSRDRVGDIVSRLQQTLANTTTRV